MFLRSSSFRNLSFCALRLWIPCSRARPIESNRPLEYFATCVCSDTLPSAGHRTRPSGTHVHSTAARCRVATGTEAVRISVASYWTYPRLPGKGCTLIPSEVRNWRMPHLPQPSLRPLLPCVSPRWTLERKFGRTRRSLITFSTRIDAATCRPISCDISRRLPATSTLRETSR